MAELQVLVTVNTDGLDALQAQLKRAVAEGNREVADTVKSAIKRRIMETIQFQRVAPPDSSIDPMIARVFGLGG
jgi:hypothetical protein